MTSDKRAAASTAQIKPQDVVNHIASIVSEGQSNEDLIRACLEALLKLGFSSSRFYELDSLDFDQGNIFVLTAQAPDDRPELHGYAILAADTALIQLGNGKSVVATDHTDLSPRPRWVDDLGFPSHWTSVDIPVVSGGELLGLLAAASPTAKLVDAINLDQLRYLLPLGTMAGSAATSARLNDSDLDVGQSGPEVSVSPDEYASVTLSNLASHCDAQMGALFRLEWRRRELQKVAEWHRGSLRESFLPERYAIGQYLTGRAWSEPRWRYVPDFDLIRTVASVPEGSLVNEGSYDYHQRLLRGELKCAMYAVLGGKEARYLVRLFNRRSDPRLPFLRQRQKFERLSRLYSGNLDTLIAQRRLHHLSEAARIGAREIGKPDAVAVAAQRLLVDEGFTNYAILSRTAGSRSLAFAHGMGALAALSVQSGLLVPTDTEDRLSKDDTDVLSRALLLERFSFLSETPVSAKVIGTLNGDFAVYMSRSGEASTLFIGEVRSDSRKRAPKRALPESSRASVLSAISLVTEAVDSKYAYHSAKGARRALGYIGHELGTPLAILGDTATNAVLTVLDELVAGRQLTDVRVAGLRVKLRSMYEQIQDSRGATDSAFKLAPLVLQAGEGILPMNVSEHSFEDVVSAAIRQVLYEARLSRDSSAISAEVEVGGNVSRVGNFPCDQYLVRQLLVNLIGNAIKYSRPRARSGPIMVTVNAQRSGSAILISVRNWGLQINEENYGVIFEAFMRGEKEERLVASRGMGLGLYLSRIIATAHRGSIELRRSETTTDPVGYTTFDVRLSGTLPLGHRLFRWDEHG